MTNSDQSENKKLDSFVPFPRKILSALRNGEISKNEYLIYGYVRLSGNPYGVAATSLENIRNDIFLGKVSINYCNQLLLSLKSKRYIYYPDRSGHRGSFEVHLGDWILPTKGIKTLDVFFVDGGVRGLPVIQSVDESLDGQSLPSNNQRIDLDLGDILKDFSWPDDNNRVRAPYNDTDTENETDNNREDFSLKKRKKWELIPLSSFTPNSHEESRCQEIGRELGDEHINGMLALLKEHGLERLETAYGIYKEDKAKGKRIKGSAGAYFTGIVGQLAMRGS